MFECAIEAIELLLKAADDDMKKQLESDGFINPDYTVQEINNLEDALTKILQAGGEVFVEGLGVIGTFKGLGKTMKDIIEELKDVDTIDQALYGEIKNFFERILPNLVGDYINTLDKDLIFSMFSQRTVDWIDSWSRDLGQLMKLTSHNEIDRILNNALKNGDSVETVIQELMDSYGFSRERARKTAITEMLRAHSYAKDEAIRQSPSVDRVEWRHSGAHKIKPRKHHQDLDGVIIGKGEKFIISAPTGTYEARFPRDVSLPASETIYCHCTHRGIVNDEIFGLSIEERRKLQEEAIAADNAEWERELDAINRAKAGIE